jgi:hypothetical protein
LRKDQERFLDGTNSIFTEPVIRRVAGGWVKNLQETEDEAFRLFPGQYFSLRYEDLLENPNKEMCKLWQFLGVQVDASLEKKIVEEMGSNPDEEWQSKRNEDIASFLPKGQAGNWRRLFTAQDKAVFKEITGDLLVKWGYEHGIDW